ncbi:hypothetical protein ElyMa_000648600, partial [Elysia marginata]
MSSRCDKTCLLFLVTFCSISSTSFGQTTYSTKETKLASVNFIEPGKRMEITCSADVVGLAKGYNDIDKLVVQRILHGNISADAVARLESDSKLDIQ